jgi:hypothetical protein
VIGHVSGKRAAGTERQAKTQDRHRRDDRFRYPKRRAERRSFPAGGSISCTPNITPERVMGPLNGHWNGRGSSDAKLSWRDCVSLAAHLSQYPNTPAYRRCGSDRPPFAVKALVKGRRIASRRLSE